MLELLQVFILGIAAYLLYQAMSSKPEVQREPQRREEPQRKPEDIDKLKSSLKEKLSKFKRDSK